MGKIVLLLITAISSWFVWNRNGRKPRPLSHQYQHHTRQPENGYEVWPFPRSRQLIVDAGRMGSRRHTIHGLLEVDVTKAFQLRQEHKARTGESLSFTAFLIACLARAVEANKSVHAYRNWRNQLIVFDEVDVLTIIEIELEGQKFPLAHIIRAANKRPLSDIHDEIRAIQSQPRDSASFDEWYFASLFLRLPAFVRDLFYRVGLQNPHLIKKYMGTVALTAVGMFGQGGWGIGLPNHSMGVTVGGTVEKPWLVNGQVENRHILCLTLDFDHDIIDGAPATRFSRQLKELIESGYGLGH